MSHGAVGLRGVAKGGKGRKELEESKERMWGKRMRVLVDEIDEVIRSERW